MNTVALIFRVSLLLLLFTACKKDKQPATPASLAILSISPDSGGADTDVMIVGRSLAANLDEHVVKFNEMEAQLVKIAGDTIWAKVPEGAGTGIITVTVGGKTATGPVFNYIKQMKVTRIAGSGIEGNADGVGNAAQFNRPEGITTDAAGNLYISDTYNHRIRKITPGGTVTTIAGSVEGGGGYDGPTARFRFPLACVMDAGGRLFIADRNNHVIRVIDLHGEVSIFAGTGPGYLDGAYDVAKFFLPTGIAIDKQNNIYVADNGNHRIRKIDMAGNVTTIAGSTAGLENGPGATAKFYGPFQLAIDGAGVLYVSDKSNHCIRTIDQQNLVRILAGTGEPGLVDGAAVASKFYFPSGIAVDSAGNVYVADTHNHRIRKISPAGLVTTFAGSIQGHLEGDALTAKFSYPMAVCVDRKGIVYVTGKNNRVSKIEPK